MKRNKFLVLLLSTLFLSSCGTFTKVFKNKNKTKENIEVSVNKETESKIEDKSKIVIEEKADTTGYTKSRKLEAINPIGRLEDIKNLNILTNQFIDIRQSYDSLSTSLKTYVFLKPQAVDLKFNKKTIIYKDVKSNIIVKQDSTYKKDSIIKTAEKIKEPKNTFWYVVLIITGVIVIIGVAYLVKKYKSKFGILKIN